MSQLLAAKMKEIRGRLSLTQDQLGELAGVEKSYISHIESGKKVPSLELAYRIEKGLGILGELSDLVINETRRNAGFEMPTAPNQSSAALPALESLCLSQSCPSCGKKVALKISLSS